MLEMAAADGLSQHGRNALRTVKSALCFLPGASCTPSYPDTAQLPALLHRQVTPSDRVCQVPFELVLGCSRTRELPARVLAFAVFFLCLSCLKCKMEAKISEKKRSPRLDQIGLRTWPMPALGFLGG